MTQYDPSLSPTEANRKMILRLSNALVSEGHRVEVHVFYDPWIDKGRGSSELSKEVRVVHTGSHRTALALLGSAQDITVVQSALGTRVFPIIQALRIREMPHLACILSSQLKFFWEKRVLGVPLPRWYGQIRNIGVYAKHQARMLGTHLPGARVHILPPVVEDPPLGRDPSQTPTILYFGSFDKKRGTDLLLNAAARLQKARPEVRIRMAIRGSQRADALEMIRGLDLPNVDIMGQVDVWRELSRAWLFVYPFQGTSPPSFPLSILEALKMGTPVLAAAKGCIPEILPGECLFDGGPEGLMEGILRQLETPCIPPCPGGFLFDNAVREHLRIFESIASGGE